MQGGQQPMKLCWAEWMGRTGNPEGTSGWADLGVFIYAGDPGIEQKIQDSEGHSTLYRTAPSSSIPRYLVYLYPSPSR